MSDALHVAVAVIKRSDRILIAKRANHLHKGGLWEFPGGKVEANESIHKALIRECEEELGISPISVKALTKIEHDYPEKRVLLDVWLITDFLGVAQGLEGQPVVWCPINELDQYSFPEANLEIIQLIKQLEY